MLKLSYRNIRYFYRIWYFNTDRSFIKISKPTVELDGFKLWEGAKDIAMNALIIRIHEAYGDEAVFNCKQAF